MRLFLVGLLFTLSNFAHAKVEVAFLQLRHPSGEIVQFEKGGEFGHVAVSYKGQWLHAHPKDGVVLTDDLSDIGTISVILMNEDLDEPTEAFIAAVLGTPFDIRKAWDDLGFTYCTKLIALYYGIDPQIMTFSSQGWKGIKNLPRGEKGLSADDLFKALFNEGFYIKKSQCENTLAPDSLQIRSLRAKFGPMKTQN